MSVVTIAEAWPADRPFTVTELDRMPDDGRRSLHPPEPPWTSTFQPL
jgi:hypothetical protein